MFSLLFHVSKLPPCTASRFNANAQHQLKQLPLDEQLRVLLRPTKHPPNKKLFSNKSNKHGLRIITLKPGSNGRKLTASQRLLLDTFHKRFAAQERTLPLSTSHYAWVGDNFIIHLALKGGVIVGYGEGSTTTRADGTQSVYLSCVGTVPKCKGIGNILITSILNFYKWSNASLISLTVDQYPFQMAEILMGLYGAYGFVRLDRPFLSFLEVTHTSQHCMTLPLTAVEWRFMWASWWFTMRDAADDFEDWDDTEAFDREDLRTWLIWAHVNGHGNSDIVEFLETFLRHESQDYDDE